MGEVRSRGLMLAVELVDPERRSEPLESALVSSLNLRAWKRGAVAVAAGSVLRVAPPLCINAAEVDELAQILGDSLRELQDELSPSPRTVAVAPAKSERVTSLDAAASPEAMTDTPYAAARLVVTLALMTVGACGMYIVPVVLPAVQAEFGVARADASMPYSLLMIGFGIGGIDHGPARRPLRRHGPAADRRGWSGLGLRGWRARRRASRASCSRMAC